MLAPPASSRLSLVRALIPDETREDQLRQIGVNRLCCDGAVVVYGQVETHGSAISLV